MRKYSIALTAEQRQELETLLQSGYSSARSLTHAQILLKSDNGPQGSNWTDKQVQESFGVGASTIRRVRQRFAAEGLEAEVQRRPQPERPQKRKLTGEQEAKLIVLCCSPAPAGREQWSIRLLANRVVELDITESVGRETVRRTLKKPFSNRG